MADNKPFPPKHPTATLDYVFDWAPKRNNKGLTNWLRDSELISAFEVTVSTGLVEVSSELINDNTSVLVWLDGGSENTDYDVVCSIETNQNRKDTRTAKLSVEKR